MLKSEVSEYFKANDQDVDDIKTEFKFLVKRRSSNESQYTQKSLSYDEDGDLVLDRKERGSMPPSDGAPEEEEEVIKVIGLRHKTATTLDLVGLQVWKGALLLVEALLAQKDHLKGCTILEMGAGVGLVSIIAANYAKFVYLTDLPGEILDMAEQNVSATCSEEAAADDEGGRKRRGKRKGEVRIRAFDFKTPSESCFVTRCCTSGMKPSSSSSAAAAAAATTREGKGEGRKDAYEWREEEDWQALATDLDLILAADVIYDDEITDDFFSKLRPLLWSGSGAKEEAEISSEERKPFTPPPQPRRCCLLALEKRIVFSVDEMDEVAHGYDHFRSHLGADYEGSMPLEGRLIPVETIPPCYLGDQSEEKDIVDYREGSYLELWEIRAKID